MLNVNSLSITTKDVQQTLGIGDINIGCQWGNDYPT